MKKRKEKSANFSGVILAGSCLFLAPALPAAEAADDSNKALSPDIEEVVVEATRATLTVLDIPVNTSILDREDISEFATKTADEILRQIPGFNLLRAGDSIASAPVINTVSLRGLGGNAASRTLVLLDGIPVHSPYSSEVYWARIPRHNIDHIEVVRGGGANSWGNLSLGGVINIVTENPRENGLDFSGAVAHPNTVDLALSASQVDDRWSYGASANWFDTDGYMNIPADQRGPIHREVWKDQGIVTGNAAYELTDNSRIRVNGSWFEEDRGAGTPLDVNSVETWTLGVGLDAGTNDGGRWTFDLFYDDSTLDDNTVRVSSDQASETLRQVRHQPKQALGTSLVWTRSLGDHDVTVGVDFRWTDLRDEKLGSFAGDQPRERATTRGSQDMGGLFVQDNWRLNDRWQANASLRYDYVTNRGAIRVDDLETASETSGETYASNAETTVNPSLGTVFRLNDRTSLRAAAYRGYRAPTLRELYSSASTRRGVNLVNNPFLAPERLVGVEAGVDFAIGGDASLRLTLFRNTVEDLVQNITRGETGELPGVVEPCGLLGPGEVCRELDNVGEMQATGLELEADWRPSANWGLFLSYLYNDNEVTKAPDNPQLVGKQVRQAPKHAFTARLRNSNRWFDTSLLARYAGTRYEDDINELEVGDFLLFDLRFSRQVSDNTRLFLAIENLFDEAYEIRVDHDGSMEIGRPRFVSLGLSYRR